MVRAEASIVINRPVEDVWAYAQDPAKWPEWQPRTIEPEKISQGPIGVGTTFRGVGMYLGRRLEGIEEITEFELHKRVKMTETMGPSSFEKTSIYEPVESGTRVTIIQEGELGGVFRFAHPGMHQRDIEGSLEGSLARLKDILEAEQ